VKDFETNVVEISMDGKQVIFKNYRNEIRWVRTVPSFEDWKKFAGNDIEQNLAKGIFQYAGIDPNGEVIAVFTPFGGLDFNLTFSSQTGQLLRIHEAR
jgi:hypothetical protein